jgi:hypothetical protein
MRGTTCRQAPSRTWAREPLDVRLATTTGNQLVLLNFPLYQGYLHPGYDYLLERSVPLCLSVVLRQDVACRSFPGSSSVSGVPGATTVGPRLAVAPR